MIKKLLFLLFLPLALFASLQKVSLQLEWKHQFEFAGFYAAKEMGYYKDAGLDVEIKEYSREIDVSDDVINSKSTFGTSSSSLILEKLKNKPIVLIASYFKQSALGIVTSEDIKNLSELKNKKIMAEEYQIEHTSLGVMFNENFLPKNSYTLVKHEFNTDKFLSGEVDAMSIFLSNETFYLDKSDKKYNLFIPSDYGIYSYDSELFTSQAVANKSPQMVQSFIDATNRGWEYAFAHKNELVNLIYDKYTQRKSKKALTYEANRIHKLFKTDTFKIGSIIPELVKLNAVVFEKLGLLKEKKLNMKNLITDYIFSPKNKTKKLVLTSKERDFINKHPIIKVGNDKFWPPFDFYENSQAKGFNVDYLKEIATLTGFEFEFVQDKNWNTLLNRFIDRDIDMLTALEPTPSRKEFALFSDDILVTFESMVIRNNYPPPNSYRDLYAKKVGVVKGYDFENEIRENHKEIDMILFDTPIEALQALSDSKIDVFLENSSVARYLIGKHFISNLKIGASPKFPNIEDGDKIKIVSRSDYRELHSIIQKAIKVMPYTTTKVLHSKWLSNIQAQKNNINFTDEELAFLKQNRVIKIANEMDWAPFDYNEFGKPVGLSIEYIKLLFNKIGLKYEFIYGYTWTEILNLFKNKKVDILPAFYKNAQREKFSLFTTPYYQGELSLFILNENKSLKKVGIEQSDASISIIKKHLKDSEIIEFPTTAMLFEQLNTKNIDALVCNPLLLKHHIKKYKLSNIKFVQDIKMNREEHREMSLHIGVQKELQHLHSILQKTINSLSKDEIEKLKEQWITHEKSDILNLTSKEREYLDNNEITMCIDPNWMPFEKIEKGLHVGMSADFFKIVEKNLGKDIRLVPTTSWSESLEFAKERKCDLLSLAMQTPERKKYMNFTTHYLEIPLVLATKIDVPFIANFKALNREKIGIPKSYAFNEILKKKYPNLNIVDVENIQDGLRKVKNGKLFGYIGTLVSVGYMFQKEFTGELKIAGKFNENWKLGIAVRNDNDTLFNIMQKSIDSIDISSKNDILNRWIAIKYEEEVDYTLIWQILLGAFIIIIGVIFWNRKLSLLNKELYKAKIKAEDATKAKSNFISNVSHEIRTPMNAIVGMSYLLKQTSLNETQHQHMSKIENASNNLLTLINDILDFSKIEANKLKLDEIDFNLIELLNQIETLISVKAYEKGLDLSVTYNKEDCISLYGDKQRLSQILTNLLSNAVKFTQEGKVELIVQKISDTQFRFKVIDSGIGLNKEQIEKLFSAFTQADESTTRKYGGTGLGLTIAKELVELMRGKITIESELDVGSQFTFDINLKTSTKILLKETQIINQTDMVEEEKIVISSEKSHDLFKELQNAVLKRRPHLCNPILEKLKSYQLEPEKEKLFNKLELLIKHYRFQEAIELFDK